MFTRSSSVASLLCLAALTAAAPAQVYQKADTTPIPPAGGNNPATYLQAVAPTPDGGYIAVGHEGTTYVHAARYDASGNVLWSRFAPTNFPIDATSINVLVPGQQFVVAGEVGDAMPWGTWTMIIDGAGNITCMPREINGVGANFTASRSPVMVKPLSDTSYVVTGRSQAAATAPVYARLTRFAPGCAGVMWSKIYTPTGGVPGLTGACEITDVVEEQAGGYLLAVGTAALSNGGSVPFLLRVAEASGVVVQSMFYGSGDPTLKVRGDGLTAAFNAAGAVTGYVFDGRSQASVTGAASPVGDYVVKVDMGLNVNWAQTFPGFEPCHACVRTSGGTTLLAGTKINSNNAASDVWGELLDSVGGAPIWGWNYGHGYERGNGVAITAATTSTTTGPIIVGVKETFTAPGSAYLVKSAITSGSSGGCEVHVPNPTPGAFQAPAQFAATDVQNIRSMEFPWIQESLRTVNACFPIHCIADFNNDGDVGTDRDIEDFFACLAGNCCETCGSADFNGDGDIGTDSDIESFFRVLSGGPC